MTCSDINTQPGLSTGGGKQDPENKAKRRKADIVKDQFFKARLKTWIQPYSILLDSPF